MTNSRIEAFELYAKIHPVKLKKSRIVDGYLFCEGLSCSNCILETEGICGLAQDTERKNLRGFLKKEDLKILRDDYPEMLI